MEERIARIEAGIEYICREAAETKLDIRELRSNVQSLESRLTVKAERFELRFIGKLEELGERLEGKLEELDKRLTIGIEELNQRINALVASVASLKVWALLLYIGLAAGMLGAMAGGYLSLINRQDEMLRQITARQDRLEDEIHTLAVAVTDIQTRFKEREPRG